ncbi:putative nuclease HARBI1 [Hetaerina americana]|uniref:putative nuclease HARBI1 n=1 Tax=Hetaerina americana TaxID=62018 RepID=UPI003A7F463F
MAEGEFYAHILVIAEEADRRERVLEMKRLRDSMNPFHIADSEFLSVFRLSKDVFGYLCDSLRERLQRQRCHGLAVETQILAALRFFAVGSYQRNVGRDFLISLSQPAMSRAIKDVATGINEVLGHKWIKFPTTAAKRSAVMKKFQEVYGMRRILGCVDATHIGIVKPSEHEEGYYNSQGFHSLNVQAICSCDMEFLSINARYPGSVHESFVWRQSAVREEMLRLWDTGETSWLIGDSEYPLEPWILTPIANASEDTAEGSYNQSLRQTMACVKNAVSVLKKTFMCLSPDKLLYYKPLDASSIVVACVVLHNIRLHHKLINEVFDNDDQVGVEGEQQCEVDEESSEVEAGEREEEAERVRSMLIENYWKK